MTFFYKVMPAKVMVSKIWKVTIFDIFTQVYVCNVGIYGTKMCLFKAKKMSRKSNYKHVVMDTSKTLIFERFLLKIQCVLDFVLFRVLQLFLKKGAFWDFWKNVQLQAAQWHTSKKVRTMFDPSLERFLCLFLEIYFFSI